MTYSFVNDFEKEVAEIMTKYLHDGSMTAEGIADSLRILATAVEMEFKDVQ